MSDAVKVDLEPYASLRAEIDAGEPLDAVIEREGISAEAWSASQAFWLKQMADEAENKRFETTTRYQTLYRTKKKLADAEVKRRKRAAEAEVPAGPYVGPLDAAEQELAARPATVVAAIALTAPPVVERSVVAPSFDRPAANVEPTAPGRVDGGASPARGSVPGFAGSGNLVAPPAMVGTPFVSPPPPSRPRLAELAARSEAANVPNVATPLQQAPQRVPEPARAVTPPSRLPAVPAAQGPSLPPAPQRESVGKTMSIDIEQLMASAVPFGLGDAKVEAVAPQAVAPPPPVPTAQERKPNLNSTMMVDLDQLKAQATPFSGGSTQTIRDADRPKMASAMPFADPARPSADSPAVPPAPASSRSVEPSMPRAPASTPQPFPAVGLSPSQMSAALSQTMVPDDEDDPRTMMLSESTQLPVGSPARPLPFGSTSVTDAPKIPAHDAMPHGGLPFARVAPAVAAPPQAPPAAAANAKIFSINQFASLTAEIAERPDQIEETRRKYGVNETQHHAESQRWTEEFAMSSELRQRYFGIVARYREYLRKKT